MNLIFERKTWSSVISLYWTRMKRPANIIIMITLRHAGNKSDSFDSFPVKIPPPHETDFWFSFPEAPISCNIWRLSMIQKPTRTQAHKDEETSGRTASQPPAASPSESHPASRPESPAAPRTAGPGPRGVEASLRVTRACLAAPSRSPGAPCPTPAAPLPRRRRRRPRPPRRRPRPRAPTRTRRRGRRRARRPRLPPGPGQPPAEKERAPRALFPSRARAVGQPVTAHADEGSGKGGGGRGGRSVGRSDFPRVRVAPARSKRRARRI